MRRITPIITFLFYNILPKNKSVLCVNSVKNCNKSAQKLTIAPFPLIIGLIMNLKQSVLNLLLQASGYLSGQEIADRLAVSRTAVWKAAEQLRRDGYEILSVTNRGYKLVNGGSVLSPSFIRENTGIAVELLESVPSTNDYAKKFPLSSLPVIVMAKRQTQGKARYGKEFSSSDRDGVYMSLALNDKLPPEYIRLITDWTTEAVKAVFGGTKEENTIIKNGTKKAGILTEAECDMDKTERIVVGIGIYTEKNEDKNKAVVEIVNEIMKRIKKIKTTL